MNANREVDRYLITSAAESVSAPSVPQTESHGALFSLLKARCTVVKTVDKFDYKRGTETGHDTCVKSQTEVVTQLSTPKQ